MECKKDEVAISQHLDMNNDNFSLHDAVAKCVKSIEKKWITEALIRTGGNKSQAAKILKIDYKTMHYKVKNYGIKIETTTKIIEKVPTEDS